MSGGVQAELEDNDLRQWKARKILTQQDLRAQRIDRDGRLAYRTFAPACISVLCWKATNW